MTSELILWPVLGQILMSQLLYIPLVKRKFAAVRNKQVDRKKASLNPDAWTEDVQKVNNNLRNQFETPILFIALCLIFYVTEQVGIAVVVLAWLYVASRLAHMAVHITTNYVPLRMRFFGIGLFIQLVMLIMAGVGLITSH